MSVNIRDSFGAAADPGLPTLAWALDPATARREFKRRLPHLSGADGKLRLKAVRVIRYKPGRRCVLECDVEVHRAGEPVRMVTLIGKVRARRAGNEDCRLQQAIWDAGFQDHSPDGISVPEPIGVISNFQMWFQRKVPGECAEKLLTGPDGLALGRHIAEGIYKLHTAGVPTRKEHLISDELNILHDCFDRVAAQFPDWSGRLERLLQEYKHLAAILRPQALCGIHRDFYASQVIVQDGRLWFLDFDLYCQGDPGLDVGNFIGHITEFAVRELGEPTALRTVEQAVENRFIELAGEAARPSVRVYTELTLARHILLSTRFADRAHLTAMLLELCEQRIRNYCV